ncbi:MAG TPA: SAM-dependent methyltransferase [Geopsychrobacteraceae bacterium]|nr:SAM-dependent methyltransferase [Geopsychrobacteraceae bacterium]
MRQVFFIGAGPGNPQLLTLQGRDCLEKSGTVFLLTPYEETYAGFLSGKEVLSPFDYDFQPLLDLIAARLVTNDVAFLIPGDLTFYAPFQGVIDHFGACALVVPGVGVANAASAALKRTLDLPDVCKRAVIVSPRTLKDTDKAAAELESLAQPGVTLLIYMNTFALEELVAILKRGYGNDVPIALLHRLTLPGEEVVCGTLENIVVACRGRDFFSRDKGCRSSLTLVVVGESLTAAVDGRWWNDKRETIWKEEAVNNRE